MCDWCGPQYDVNKCAPLRQCHPVKNTQADKHSRWLCSLHGSEPSKQIDSTNRDLGINPRIGMCFKEASLAGQIGLRRRQSNQITLVRIGHCRVLSQQLGTDLGESWAGRGVCCPATLEQAPVPRGCCRCRVLRTSTCEHDRRNFVRKARIVCHNVTVRFGSAPNLPEDNPKTKN